MLSGSGDAAQFLSDADAERLDKRTAAGREGAIPGRVPKSTGRIARGSLENGIVAEDILRLPEVTALLRVGRNVSFAL